MTISKDLKPTELSWREVEKKKWASLVLDYKFQVVEVEHSDLVEIRELFVRINSTGKSLTSAEKRNAKYLTSDLLQEAKALSRKHKKYLTALIKPGQISRMKDIELICELLASIHNGGPIDKKKAVDKMMGGSGLSKSEIRRSSDEFTEVLGKIRKMFPDLTSPSTRFSKVADFYSLFLLVYELKREGCILDDQQRNKEAQSLLALLEKGVATVQEQRRRVEGARPEQDIFKEYLFTVQGDTDSLRTRRNRAAILRRIFGDLFDKKDKRRHFTPEQRRLIWHSDEEKKCKACQLSLAWDDFTIDHKAPHSKGGRTSLANAALMCRSCNSRKGIR